MRETRLSGSEGGVKFNPSSLPLSMSGAAAYFSPFDFRNSRLILRLSNGSRLHSSCSTR